MLRSARGLWPQLEGVSPNSVEKSYSVYRHL